MQPSKQDSNSAFSAGECMYVCAAILFHFFVDVYTVTLSFSEFCALSFLLFFMDSVKCLELLSCRIHECTNLC